MSGSWSRFGILALVSCVLLGPALSPASAQSAPLANQLFRVPLGGGVSSAALQAAAAAQGLAANDAYREDQFNPYMVSNFSGGFLNRGARATAGFCSVGARGNDAGFGSSLSGGADTLGQFLVSTQQALLIQQAVVREQLRNRRRLLDEWLYERANTPTLEQLRQEGLALEWSRSRNDPPVTEIYSGKALNSLLGGLLKIEQQGGELRPVKLSAELLAHINVDSTQQGGNFALLRDGGKLHWPLALTGLAPEEETGADRKQVEALFTAALAQAAEGQLDAHIIKNLQGDVETLRGLLKQHLRDFTFPEYNAGQRYLDQLDEAIKVLERPDAARYVNGTYRLTGHQIQTVPELLRYMSEQGLTFAPSVSGDESAYLALQRALASYDGSSTSQAVTPAKPGDL